MRAGIEHAHGDLEALAFLAQHVLGLRHVIIELDLAGGEARMPSLARSCHEPETALSVSMRKAVMPRAHLSGSLIANRTMYLAPGRR